MSCVFIKVVALTLGLFPTAIVTFSLAGESNVRRVPKNHKTAVSKEVWKMIEGDWIRKDFVQDVQKKRSIFIVMKTKGIGFNSSKLLTFSFVQDFGDYAVIRRAKECWVKSLSRKDNIVNLGVDGAGKKNDFCEDFPQSLRLLSNEPRPGEIEISGIAYVRDSKDWLARAAISGTYRDESGRDFKFSPDGKAQWPEREFRYSVGKRNFEGNQSDYFQVVSKVKPKTGDYYCFRWQDAALLIQPMTFDNKGESSGCASTPVYRLLPSSSQ